MDTVRQHLKVDHEAYWGQPNDWWTHDADAPCSLCEVERLRDALDAVGKSQTEKHIEVERLREAVLGADELNAVFLAEVERLRALQVPVTRTDAKAFERRAEAAEAEVERAKTAAVGFMAERDALEEEVERLRHQRWAFDESKLSRVTLVNEQGIAYERYGIDVAVSVQDEGRTLKVFVHEADQR